jgi:TolA-binding protein
MTMHILQIGRFARKPFWRAGLILGLMLGTGCQAPDALAPEGSGMDLSRFKFWQRSDDELTNTDNIRGPLERILGGHARRRQDSLAPLEGSPEFDEAQAIYRSGDYAEAEKRFKQLAKAYKDTPIEEDSLFMVGECQFATGRYAKAQDSYGKLLKKYPSPRGLDTVTKRLFEIAKTWLEFPEVVTSTEVQTVSLEDPKNTPPPENPGPRSKDPSRLVPIFPNVWDRSRPVFDTDGRALEALRAIWLNDPTGPLADDAIMLTASYHLRKGDFLEADRNYTILREQYPKSPHLENAFFLGGHVKLMSYQGPLYEGDSLDAAHKLRESTLRLYPKHPQRERLLDEVREIEEAKAEREWENVVFWQKKNKPLSIATSCREVIRLYPNSSYAAQAREVLAGMDQAEQ